jgi:hypothetical protein
MTTSSMNQRDERKRTFDEASKDSSEGTKTRSFTLIWDEHGR